MTDLEDRLRHDLKQLSERAQPGSIRPLRVPAMPRRSRAARRLAPVAAIAAVIGVITGVSLLAPAAVQRPAPGAGPAGMPRYYVTLEQNRRMEKNRPNAMTAPVRGCATGAAITAIVRDSATGAAVTAVRVPAPAGPALDITAAGDDRTFVITEFGGPTERGECYDLYLLRVAADGRSASLRRLPISVAERLAGEAVLSPDGRRLAMEVGSCPGPSCYVGIRVVTLATGAASTWTTPELPPATVMSWDGNGQVFFAWKRGFRLLSISGASRDLLLASRAVAPAAVALNVPGALVTPDGSAIITSEVQSIPDGHGHDTMVSKIVELSLTTGRLLHVLDTATVRVATSNPIAGATGDACQVRALGPTGVHVLIYCLGFGSGFGRLDGTQFTPLPGVPGIDSSTTGTWATGDW